MSEYVYIQWIDNASHGAPSWSQGHSMSSTPTYSARDQSLQVAPTAELLARRETLQRLDLSGNELNERMLSSLAGLRALRHLTLARCGIMLPPPWACTLPSLERLDLSQNRLERLDPVITEANASSCRTTSSRRCRWGVFERCLVS